MGSFKYSTDELNINKVLKMNQDNSTALLNDPSMDISRKAADNNIESSIELLRLLGRNKDILEMSTEIVNNGYDRKLKNRPQLESWEEIVSQANICEPNEVELEDILKK